jgi:SPP1 gp7 family putative phage head morphogenesis protein
MAWLRQAVADGILEMELYEQVGDAFNDAWTNVYIRQAYERGILRGRQELEIAGFDVPSIVETGGLAASFAYPMHADRAGLIYLRTFSDLKGITDAMDSQISKILAQGITEGKNPYELARLLIRTMSGPDEDLGITDTLGRFIPAERRAKMLARTEIIRAHHLATIQEYENWGVLGVKVKAEWQTAGDERVCPICLALEGRIYTLDEIRGMIPKHPNCFIDSQVPVYTSKGWKPIGKIKVGDLVLTHKKRFRRVYALPRSKGAPEVVKFSIKNYRTMTVTANHLVLVTTPSGRCRWKEAQYVIQKDKLWLLASECARCGKLIPFFHKYCGRTCLSLDITDKQWANPKHREIIRMKVGKRMKELYALGLRDGRQDTAAAHAKVRELVAKGLFSTEKTSKILTAFNKSNRGRRLSSERMKKNNPMRNSIYAKKSRDSRQEMYINNPERRLNARMAKHRKSSKMTYIEQRMAELLRKLGISYIFQYPVLKYDVDFAIPALKIAIECDGEYWHRDKQADDIRQKRIENEGWFVLRYSGSKINQCLEEIQGEILRVVQNHIGEYKTLAWPITKIDRKVLKKNRRLYNLSVREDESYIARGVIVHNCRCVALPVDVTDEK